MTANPNTISFSLTLDEILSAFRKRFFAWFWPWALWLYLPAFAALNIYLYGHSPNHMAFGDWLTPNFILLTLVSLLNLWVYRLSVTRRYNLYKGVPEFLTDLSWELQEDGLVFRRRDDRMFFPWKIFKSAGFIGDYLVLHRTDRNEHLLPRKYFPDGGAAWRETINAGIKGQNASQPPA